MAEVVYLLGAITSLFCAVLLARAYRASGSRLLLWSALCFSGLTVNSALVVVDLLLVPEVDLAILRGAVALASILLMLVGLIWESK